MKKVMARQTIPSHAYEVCPIWVGHLLNNPLRKLYQNPQKILGRHVHEGMTVLDFGCAMGFFTLPLARMVGPEGKVIAVDVQAGMIDKLAKRARKAGVSNRIAARVCPPAALGLEEFNGKIDFVLAFAAVHEVPDASHFFREVSTLLKPAGKLLLAEPKGHVSDSKFKATLTIAEQDGFRILQPLRIFRSYGNLLEKAQTSS